MLINKSTQYQVERRITLHLGASVESPGEGNEKDGQYFAPRIYAKRAPNRQDADWGDGQPIYLTFAIEDTGCGLNEDEKNKLFKRFSQASPKTHVDYGVNRSHATSS
jgi:signal transduction histidine kinase